MTSEAVCEEGKWDGIHDEGIHLCVHEGQRQYIYKGVL